MSTAATTNTITIAEHAQSCLRLFRVAQDSFANSSAIANTVDPTISAGLSDENSRFRLWCGNIGAHQRGRSSLDHKLRDASHIKDRVAELLQRLSVQLEDIGAILSGRKVPWDAVIEDDSDGSEDESEESEASTTELQQLVDSTGTLITDLMQLSSTIRNPAPHDLFKQSHDIDTSHFESYDIQHVRGKYPSAEPFLIERMGRAISRRRLYLRYREDHRARLAEGLDAGEGSTKDLDGTVASSVASHLKSGAPKEDVNDNIDTDDHASQTSYASSISGPSTLRPPPLPEAGQDGKPFECPLCRYITTISQYDAWQKHVYADLQPYLCTIEDCITPDRTYESRGQWFSHELQEHRRQWTRVEGCQQSFQSMERFEAHLRPGHSHLAAGRGLQILSESHSTSQNRSTGTVCSLCQTRCQSLKQLRAHLGRHQRELSLFAVPPSVHEDNDEDSEQDSGSSETESSDRLVTVSLKTRVMVPEYSVASIVDSSWKIKQRTDCWIELIHPAVNSLYHIDLHGSRAAAAHAKRLIMGIVGSVALETNMDFLQVSGEHISPQEDSDASSYEGSSEELFENAIGDHVRKTRGMRTQDLPGDGESGLQKGENMAVGEGSWDSSAVTTSMEEKKKGKGAVEEESLLSPRQPAPRYAEPELDDAQYDDEPEFYSDEEVEHYARHAYGAYDAHPRPETNVDPEIPLIEQDTDLEDASAQQQFLPQFTIANFDHISPGGSPTISPRLIPQGAYPQDPEAIPSLNDFGQADTMSPPEINIDIAPPSRQALFEPPKPGSMADALTDTLSPPDRSRSRVSARFRSDPVSSASWRTVTRGSVANRSLSHSPPSIEERTSRASGRDYVLDLADPSRLSPGEAEGSKRTQKHPATFQCTLCPKRFTRAYNLRSHLRTHTDERPFICSVCGKAFARQHDRRQHEELHSSENRGSLEETGQLPPSTLAGGEQLRENQDLEVPADKTLLDENLADNVSSQSTHNPQDSLTAPDEEEANADSQSLSLSELTETTESNKDILPKFTSGKQMYRWTCCACHGDNSYGDHPGCIDCHNHWRCEGCTLYAAREDVDMMYMQYRA